MALTEFGFIEILDKQHWGYVLLLYCPIAYDVKTLRFIIWGDRVILGEDGNKRFERGDTVRVNYHFEDGTFPILDEIHPAEFDLCSKCSAANERNNSENENCDKCPSLPSDKLPEQIRETMRLMNCISKQYIYSTGYKLELLPLVLDPVNCRGPFICDIFDTDLLFDKIPDLKIGNVYTVCGWKRGNLLRLLNIS